VILANLEVVGHLDQKARLVNLDFQVFQDFQGQKATKVYLEFQDL
jgi:hypothetical protein